MSLLTLLSGAASGEPVTLAQAKLQCRVIDTSEDTLITALITAAREFVENRTGHILARRTFTDQRDNFGRFIELDRRPVASISAVTYMDVAGVATTYTGFVTNLDRPTARIYPALNGYWPAYIGSGGVTVTYVAGYAAGTIPQALIQAMLILIATWYGQREAVTRDQANEVPFAVDALCEPFRAMLI